MKKVIFKTHESGFRSVKSTEDKYILLSLFVGCSRYPSDIQEWIEMFEELQSGAKTWEELIKPYGFIDEYHFAEGSGFLTFEDTETALFMSDGGVYKTIEMPLQELIDLMKEWLAFMS